jgi:7-keto-8-aminopelargonate synthetase-like enzyme
MHPEELHATLLQKLHFFNHINYPTYSLGYHRLRICATTSDQDGGSMRIAHHTVYLRGFSVLDVEM